VGAILTWKKYNKKYEKIRKNTKKYEKKSMLKSRGNFAEV
jgi:hypothetical protein